MAAILYGANPIDLIPDVIPVLGWMDDGIVGAICLLFAVHFYLKRRRSERSTLRAIGWRAKK